MARVLLNIPARAYPGDILVIRTLIQHVMETGYRPDADGVVAPRDILRRFTCTYDGEVVMEADFSPAIAANPYLTFTLTATRTGTITLRWQGDNGFDQTETRELVVV